MTTTTQISQLRCFQAISNFQFLFTSHICPLSEHHPPSDHESIR